MFREGSPLRRSISHRSFKMRRLGGSTKSLATSPTISSKFSTHSREGSVKSLALPDQLEEEATSGWKSLRRKLSLKKLISSEGKASSAEATPSSPRGGPRAHPLAPANINAVNAKLLSIVQSVEEDDDSPRAVTRRDMPLCWMDHTQVKVKYNINHHNHMDKDIFTRLFIRPPTKHLARHIMTYLRIKDFAMAFKVSRSWRNFLLRELDPTLIPKIRRIKTKKRKPRPVPPTGQADTNPRFQDADTNLSSKDADTNSPSKDADTNLPSENADTNIPSRDENTNAPSEEADNNSCPKDSDTNPFENASNSNK